jgi:putative flippase GtrA
MKEVFFMSKLSDIDNKAAEKGKALVTFWQFVKFIFVSLLATLVQFATLNILLLIPQIKEIISNPYSFWVFASDGLEENGLGYFIAFNIANILAQIVAFFVNKEKTFNSGANVAITLPIYIVFTLLLICFSAWLSPTLQGLFVTWGIGAQGAANISTMCCSAIQFFIYFPVDKILFHKKAVKNDAVDKASDNTAE